jgi:hypothetical protein
VTLSCHSEAVEPALSAVEGPKNPYKNTIKFKVVGN